MDFDAQEEWRPVVGFEGWYEVSNIGRVRRIKAANTAKAGRILKPWKLNGYWSVQMTKGTLKDKKQYRIHRLVAAAFLDTVLGKPYVNHKDGNPLNNYVDNLEYCTLKENSRHAAALGRWSGPAKPRAPRPRKISKEDADKIIRLFGILNASQLARAFNVSPPTILGIVRSHVWEDAA